MTQNNKVALITGANKGIGLEITRQLGKQNITVVVGSRDLAKGQKAVDELRAENIDAHAVKLEVTDENDRAALPSFLETNFGRLDILVNNAGIMNEADGITPDAFHAGYDANVVAPYFLTQTLLPLIKQSPAGRIVHQSSILGSLSFTASGNLPQEYLLPIYASGKAALNMLTVVDAQKLKDTKVKINAAHPGSVKTDMNPQGDLTVQEGAKTAVLLATLPDDGPSGGFFHMGKTLDW